MARSISFLRPAVLSGSGALFSPGALVQQPSALLFIAGQIAIDEEGSIVGVNDLFAQVRQVFKNIEAVLGEGDMELTDLAKLTTYIVGASRLPEFVTTRAEIFPELFGKGPYPANTLLVVDRLPRPQCLVEIEGIAARGVLI